MNKRIFLLAIVAIIFFTGCAVNKKNYDPDKKYSKQQLQKDYTLLRNILEKKHPSLYWYTSKDSMDYFFDQGYQSIPDSMTEFQFGWEVVAPLLHNIRCGHTSFAMSNGWDKFIKTRAIPSFPLEVRVWGDTMVVTDNHSTKDSTIKRGMVITSINGISVHKMVQDIFGYLPLDGYADNVDYAQLSNNFPYCHRIAYGIFKNYSVDYIDSTGQEKRVLLPLYYPPVDSSKQEKKAYTRNCYKQDPLIKISKLQLKKQRIENYLSLSIDTSIDAATMSLNTFSRGDGAHLRVFFRRSFRKMRKERISNFILDLRSNGGGDVGMYVLLTKYLRNTPFKMADSVFAVSGTLRPYTKYIEHGFFNNVRLFFQTKKQQDGNYHFGYWERHSFYPKIKNHFNGKVYVLVNGPTFSSATLFCNAVKGQNNIKLVGEETGGGWYGNNGIMIPDITLPITKLKVRLPLFRIVQYHHINEKGTGVMPDIFLPPAIMRIRKSIDGKMELARELIKENNKK